MVKSADNPLAISVIIPAQNEAGYIGRLLKDLSSQSFQDFEVILADSSQSDRTKQVAKKFAKKLRIKYVKSLPLGIAAGRNRGAKKAAGWYLYFCDADSRLPPNYLAILFQEAELHHVDLLTTPIAADSNSPVDRFIVWSWSAVRRLFTLLYLPRTAGQAIFVNRQLFEKVKGFDVSLKVGEDIDFGKRAARWGSFRYVARTRAYISCRRFSREGRFWTFLRLVLTEFNTDAERLRARNKN